MKTWTVDQIMAEGPCYARAQVEALFGRRKRLSLLDILCREDVPAADRVWVACRPGALPADVRQRWVDGIVGRAVRTYALPHPATRAWAERWLSGADRTAAAAAWAEAEAAAAWAEAEAAAEAARAARAAARAAAASERARQVADLIAMLEAGQA